MSGPGLSREALLAGLHDIRLPTEASGGVWAEFAVAIGLAALASVLCLGLVALFSTRRPKARAGPDRALADILALPETARRGPLLRLLRDQAPAAYADLTKGEALYRPGALPLEAIEAAVRRHV